MVVVVVVIRLKMCECGKGGKGQLPAQARSKSFRSPLLDVRELPVRQEEYAREGPLLSECLVPTQELQLLLVSPPRLSPAKLSNQPLITTIRVGERGGGGMRTYHRR